MRLLIVEDDRKLAEFVARGLRAERFAVDLAGDGLEGLRYIDTYDYDLLVVDLMLPRLSGTELLSRVRRAHPSLPVLVLTARDATEDKVRHFEAGADDYLTKPFDFAELVVRIKALLRRGPAPRTDQLRIGDLEVNRLTQQVRRAGQRIELTAKEYGVLEYLLSSPGRVFSRTMILEHVWDQSFEGVTNIVDVYMRYLRRKLDEPFPVKLIHTVRGVGYCIREPEQRPREAEPS
ncbi:MAG TPA: response regulator transcription factor [Steroidobacteraceae bacterium]|jgi:two-component system copper resistance phosphate regulon response regulator CusR|nr:response regulator transcription factor [Steroidobacteraceae bacterium]